MSTTETSPDLRFPRVVLLVSPWRGKTRTERARNVAYLRAARRDCLARGEIPVATHALLGDAIDPAAECEVKLAIESAAHLAPLCKAVVAYVDEGTTEGMRRQVSLVQALLGAPELRMLPSWQWPQGSGPAAETTPA